MPAQHAPPRISLSNPARFLGVSDSVSATMFFLGPFLVHQHLLYFDSAKVKPLCFPPPLDEEQQGIMKMSE
jgi:hypothetical protein